VADKCSIDLQDRLIVLLGDQATPEELEIKVKEFEDRLIAAADRAEKEGLDTYEALDKILSEEKTLTLKQEYEKVFQNTALNENIRRVKEFNSDVDKGVQSLLFDIAGDTRESGLNFENVSKSAEDIQLATLLNSIERTIPGGIDRIKSGEFDKDLFALNFDKLGEDVIGSMPKESLDLFKSIKSMTDLNHKLQTEAGVQSSYRSDRLMKQRHDSDNILDMGKDQYVELVEKYIDMEASGIKDAADLYDKITTEPISVTRSNVSLQKASLESKRSIVFKDGQSAYEYHKAVNQTSVIESVFKDVTESSRFIGAATIFGPNPRKGFNDILASFEGLEQDQIKDLGKQFDYIRYGEQKNRNWKARSGAMIRRVINLNKLGLGLLSTVTDIPIGAGVRSAQTGKNYWQSLSGTAVDQFKLFADSGRSEKVASMLGVAVKDIQEDLIFGGGEVGGQGGFTSAFDKSSNFLMGLTGLGRQSRSIRRALAKGAAADISDNLKLDWNSISPELKSSFSRLNMGEFDFNILKRAELEDIGGGIMVIPIESIESIDVSSDFSSKIDGERYKTRLALKYNSILTRVSKGSPMPGAREVAINKDINPNTYVGQLHRFILQYKSFPISVMGAMREAVGTQGWNKDAVSRVASIAVSSMGLAYLSMGLRNIAKGKDPEKALPELDSRGIIELATRAGIGGLYADFILSDHSGPFRSAAKDLVGPGGQLLDDTLSLLQNTTKAAFSDDPKASKKARRDFVDLLEHTTPAIPFTKALINDRIFETMHRELNTGRKPRRR